MKKMLWFLLLPLWVGLACNYFEPAATAIVPAATEVIFPTVVETSEPLVSETVPSEPVLVTEEVEASSELPTETSEPPAESAASEPETQRIKFETNATQATVQGNLPAYGAARYVLKALKGQTMTVSLPGMPVGSAALIIWGKDGTVLISDHAGATEWSGKLPLTQDYYIDVRAGEAAIQYKLKVVIPPLPAPAPTQSSNVIPLKFAPGGTKLEFSDTMTTGEVHHFVLRAMKGQEMTVKLTLHKGQAILVIWGADGTVLISDHAGASEWVGILPLSQDYYIDVRAVGDQKVKYDMLVKIPPL